MSVVTGIRALVPIVALSLASCVGGDGGLPASGLDERPENMSCVAPEREPVIARVSTPRAFPNLAFAEPVALMQAPGDDSRWFVVERAGRIRAFRNDESAAATQDFLDLRARIGRSRADGLLGLAFHPDFEATGLAYVNYVTKSGNEVRSVTAEFSSPDGGLTLDPGSERVLLSVDTQLTGRNGGNLAFGPDGFLYIGLGDGGNPGGNPRDARTLLGKMLRIDVDRRPAGAPYGIPSDNPFAGNATCGAGGGGIDACPEIYALGFRNPRHWSFDRPSGVLWLADTGPGGFDEIHHVERGGNYDRTDPVTKQARRPGRAIIGGYVYRGSQAPTLAGRYVFADSGSGRIASVVPATGAGLSIEPMVRAGDAPAGAGGPAGVSAFGQALDGELLLLDSPSGGIRRLVLAAEGDPDNIPELLSETGCLNTSSPGAPPLLSLIPYGLNAAFWSDGAHKERWLGLPEGESISVPENGDWDLPDGTVIVKHFRLGERLAETRLFMRHPDGVWAGYTYQWNEAQTDATRVRGGLVAPIEGQDWTFPSESDCMFCHNSAAGFSLGLETAQLNGDHTYPQTGRTSNQITTLNSIDVLSPPVAPDPPAYVDPGDATQPLDARARSYLHTNCSFCHRPGGPTPALMDLRNATPLAATSACDVVPTIDDLGIPDARIIAPGDPDRSELLSRMSRRDFAGMPPIASRLPDTEGVALIRAWIESLTPANCL